MIGAMLVFAPAAFAASQPTIVPIRAQQVSGSEEMVEVEVNAQGFASRYAIELFAVIDPNAPNPSASYLPQGAQTTVGRIPVGSGVTQETATFTELEPGWDYFYRVFAYNKSEGETQEKVYSFGFGAEDPYAEHLPSFPYVPRASLGSDEAAEEMTARIVQEVDEKRAQVAKEHEQELAHEREEIAAAEARNKRLSEQNVPNPSPTRKCIVPSLHNDSLHRAERAIKASGCAVGRISRPRSKRHGVLVVQRQSHRRGERLPVGTRIAVVLGWRATRR